MSFARFGGSKSLVHYCAAAIARFGTRRRSCRGQPPHNDGGQARPAVVATGATVGGGRGGGSSGWWGPVTGSHPRALEP